jgi:hypothetical protein
MTKKQQSIRIQLRLEWILFLKKGNFFSKSINNHLMNSKLRIIGKLGWLMIEDLADSYQFLYNDDEMVLCNSMSMGEKNKWKIKKQWRPAF